MARTLMSAPPTSRVGRYPKHTFNVQTMPYTLSPLMIAPVLPGETLENVKFEMRAVTNPIADRIIGWKQEVYLAYVRATDLQSDTFRDMFVDPANAEIGGGIPANNQATYTAKGGVDYMSMCLKRVWECYFSDEGDVITDHDVQGFNNRVNGLPFVQIKDRFWLDSLTDKDAMPLGADPGTATSLNQLEAMEAAYEQLRALGIANMTYFDFLRSYGIAVPSAEEHKPEMLAKWTDFQYPSNTIDPTNGQATSAVSWVFNNTVRDNKFFKEPGFLVAFAVTRPKVYYGLLSGSLASHMTRAWDWVPNYLNEGLGDANMPFTSLKKFAADTGPLGDRAAATDAYWVDMRDLFIYGDQFHNNVNWDGAFSNSNFVNLPPANDMQNYKYPQNIGDIQNLFAMVPGEEPDSWVVTQTPFTAMDGYFSLSIKGKQVDYTVGNFAEA